MSVKKKSKPSRVTEAAGEKSVPEADVQRPRELGGRNQGLEPTRYGDWEKNGRCIDF